jgi:hypothetical protein
MPDVMDILRNLPQAAASADVPADQAVVAADVARGHQAVSRRRQKRIGFAAAAVAAVAALAVGAGQLGTTVDNQSTVAGGSGVKTASPQLAAYTGKQPAGFTVRTVPDGWTVISSNEFEFVVAPPGKETGGGPSAGPSTGPAPVMYDDRIAVFMLGDSPVPKDPQSEKVNINGKEGKLGSFPKSRTSPDTRWLMFPSDKGTVMVQVPDSTGLSNDQIVSFAEGITVTGALEKIGG